MDRIEIPINVYLDLSKSFDTLDHKFCWHKLDYYGIGGTCLALLKSYLAQRKQFVEFNGVKSSLANITTGVSQWSILGPLLFILYTNDISNACNIFKSLAYADNTKLVSRLSTFTSHGKSTVSDNIIEEFAKNDELLKLNKLSLNVNKSKFMVFYTPGRNVNIPNLHINCIKLECLDSFNFLGITIAKHGKNT